MKQVIGFAAVVVGLCGCGVGSAPSAHLSGDVTIDGKPVPADAIASLSFVPTKGGEAVAVSIVDGHYDSPQSPQGKVSVLFSISKPFGPEKVSERTGEKYRDVMNLVPPEHAAGIAIEVQGDNSSQDFDL